MRRARRPKLLALRQVVYLVVGLSSLHVELPRYLR